MSKHEVGANGDTIWAARTLARQPSIALLLLFGASACASHDAGEDASISSQREALQCVQGELSSFATWAVGKSYTAGTLVRYAKDNKVYSCVQGHTSQTNFAPDRVPALWIKSPTCGVAEWETQTGYNVGDVVTLNGKKYRSLAGYTPQTASQVAWAPGTPGTETLWEALPPDLQCKPPAASSFGTDLPSGATAQVGAIPASFSVSPNGSAVYRMPIDAPLGRGEIQPSLAITYDSDGGNDLLGMRFRVEGFSGVARCGSNISDDGERRDVRFDDKDHFCLDGRRLVPVASMGSTTEYRTQPDSFQKVIGYFGANRSLGPVSFTSYRKDGTIAEYGGKPESTPTSDDATARVMVNGGVTASWEVSKISDRSGNFASYVYYSKQTSEGDGDYTAQHMPRAIHYTGHQSAGSSSPDYAPERHIEFAYNPPDARRFAADGFSHGMHFLKPDLLQKIEVTGPSGLYARYSFQYETRPTQTGRDRLSSITQEGSDGKALPVTKFTWSGGNINPSAIFPQTSQLDTHLTFNTTGTQANALYFNVTADLTRDGLEDLVTVRSDLTGDPAKPYRNTVSIANQQHSTAQVVFGEYNFDHGPVVWDGLAVSAALPVDYEQDGFNDLLIVPNTRFSGDAPRMLELIHNQLNHGYVHSVTSIPLPDAAPYLADINGDAVPDLIMCGTGTQHDEWEARIWTKENGSEPYGIRTPIPAFKGFPCTLGRVFSGDDRNNPNFSAYRYQNVPDDFAAIDLDGDGVDELVVADGVNNCRTHNNLSGDPAHLWSVSWDWKNKRFTSKTDTKLLLADLAAYRQLDLNGDGLTDLVSLKDCDVKELQVLLNTGAGFKQHPAPTLDYSGSHLTDAVVLDIDGDGRKELLIPPSLSQIANSADPKELPFQLLRFPAFAQEGVDIRGKDIIADPTGSGAPILRVGDTRSANSLIWESPVTKRLRRAFNKAEGMPDMVTAIQDGNNAPGGDGLHNAGITVTYSPLFNASSGGPEELNFGATGYTTGLCNYPLECIFGWKPVVHEYDTYGGAEDVSTQMYYQDGLFDVLGRGWLGFASVRADSSSAATGRTWLEGWTYDNRTLDGTQRYSRAGMVASHWRASVNKGTCDSELEHIDYALDVRTRANSLLTYSYRPQKRTERRKIGASCDLIDSPLSSPFFGTNLPERTIETTPRLEGGEPDEAGNVATFTITNSDSSRLVTTLQYQQESPADWLVGRPTLATAVSTEKVNGAKVSQTRQSSWTYDARGLLTSTVVAPGVPARQLATITDRDDFGNVIRSTTIGSEAGATVTRQSCVAYDAAEHVLPVSSKDATGATTSVKFDRNKGVALQAVDANQLRTKWSYDAVGRMTKEVRADGTETVVARSAALASGTRELRLHERTVGSDGSDVESEYDSLGHMVARRTFVVGDTANDDNRAVELWGYDANGNLIVHGPPHRDGDPDPVLYDRMKFDGLGRLVLASRAVGNSSVRYNGLETVTTNALGHETHVFRDAAGRVVKSQDAKGGITTYQFGPFGKLVEMLDPVGQSKAGHLRSWQYDDYGSLLQATDPDRGTTQYNYSAFGLLTNLVLADHSEKKYSYDLSARPLTADTRDGHTAWTWDQGQAGIGQLSSIAGPDTNVVKSYVHDQFGRLKTATTRSGALSADVTYRYDSSGRVSSVVYPSEAAAFEVQYDFDKGYATKATDISDPAHPSALWTWNQADSSNRVVDDSLGAAAARVRHFDNRHGGALDRLSTKHGSQVLQNLAYEHDGNDNLSARKDLGGWRYQGQTGPAHSESFCYDELDRITDGTLDQPVSCGHGNPYHYSYDADGNITSKSGEGALLYDPAHPHALRTAGTRSYGYDAVGNQITRPRFPDPSGAASLLGNPRVQYSALDLPKAFFAGNVGAGAVSSCNGSNSGTANCYCGDVTDGAGVTTNWCSDFPITFQYDGNGTRLRKDTPDLTSFYVDGLYERVTDRHTSQTTHRYYIPTPAGVVGLVSRKTLSTGQYVAGSRAVQYTLTDHAGSADAVIDGAGNTIERHSYDPFGQRRSASWTPDAVAGRQESDPNLTGYTGHQDDFELGLINMRGRMYDPKIGRFLTPDPIIGNALNSQSLNHYSYVGNNPLSFFDPTGLERMQVDYAPADGSDLEVTLYADSSPFDFSITFLNIPIGGTGISEGPVWGINNNFGWGTISRVNTQPLVDQIDRTMRREVTKAAHAYATAAILYCMPLRVVVAIAAIGLLDPSPASAPPSDGSFSPSYRHSNARVAAGIAIPAVLGAIGRGNGGASAEEVASIESQLGQKGGGVAAETDALVFAHGTSPESASSVVKSLDSQAASDASLGGTALENGSFFAHPLGPPSAPGEGLQLAYEWGLRHSPSPAVVIGRIPGSTAQRLIARGQLQILPLTGAGVPQLVFSPGSFSEVNASVTWLQTIQF